MKRVLVAAAALLLPACSTAGAVSVAGSFSAPAPSEVRYMLHQGYGMGAMDRAFSGGVVKPGEFRSIYPDASGAFASTIDPVAFHSPPMKAPPPAYWLAFSNEKDVIYGMGQTKDGFAYRTVQAGTNAPVDKAGACWVIKSGEFVWPEAAGGRSVTLKVAIEPNPGATKSCADAPAVPQ